MSSRYSNTKIKKDDKGKLQYGTTIYPTLPPQSSDVFVMTQPGDRLDLLANQYYGDQDLWWIIANANDDCGKGSTAVPPNKQLRIPMNPTAYKQALKQAQGD
tara:strand:+ start:277 stop:582 length:306 start_codon:yes stop_codon:yes gene_type:complete